MRSVVIEAGRPRSQAGCRHQHHSARWAIAQRTTGLTETDVERAIASGAILRTHVLRPTWHFVLPEDVRWMLALTAPRIRGAMAYYDRQVELDAKEFRKSNAAIAERLRGVLANSRVDALMGHVVCVDGQLVGGWRRTLGKMTEVELRLLIPLTARERDLVGRAAERFGRFLQLPVRVRSVAS